MGPGKIRSFLNQPRRWHQGGIKAGETARKTMGDQIRWYGNKFSAFNCGTVHPITITEDMATTIGTFDKDYIKPKATAKDQTVNRINVSQIQFTPQQERLFTGKFGVGTLKTIGLQMLSMILGPVYVDVFRQALLGKPLDFKAILSREALLRKPFEFKATVSREDQQIWYKDLLS